MPAKVVSFINYKGGVGKTTTTYHIGCCLAQHHLKRVLLIDIDPQTNLTFLCATYDDWKAHKGAKGTIADLYKSFQAKKGLDVKRRIWQTPIRTGSGRLKSLDLLPCDIDLLGEDIGGGQITGAHSSLDALRKNADAFLRERRFLRQLIEEVNDSYDYVLIDCPPNLYLMTENALCASSHYVVTAIPDHLSAIGLNILVNKAKAIGDRLDSASTLANATKKGKVGVAELGGIVFVKVRTGGTRVTQTHASKMLQVRSLFPNKCFETNTTELIGFGEAAENSLPVWMNATQNSKSAASKNEYQDITSEFLKRL